MYLANPHVFDQSARTSNICGQSTTTCATGCIKQCGLSPGSGLVLTHWFRGIQALPTTPQGAQRVCRDFVSRIRAPQDIKPFQSETESLAFSTTEACFDLSVPKTIDYTMRPVRAASGGACFLCGERPRAELRRSVPGKWSMTATSGHY